MNAHYIQPLKHTVLPVRHIVFDTETQPVHRAGAIEHRYVIAIAQRFDPRLTEPTPHYSFKKPSDLWKWVAGQARRGQRTIVWAHNLSFDLRTSEALRWLPREGFHLQGIVLERTASWASWGSKERGSLVFCDLYAWLPRALGDIAKEMGVSRETWDTERHAAATPEDLYIRCCKDVEITGRAIMALFKWLKDEDCGPFRLTGSGQAHACWRKRFNAGHLKPQQGIFVHNDPGLRQVEREAMWTGRCEAWRHGGVSGPLYEYDMNLAYCRIAAQYTLPTKLNGKHGPVEWNQLKIPMAEGLAILAEVDVDTEEPLVPCRLGERMIWPIGQFQTVLWEPELHLLANSKKASFKIKRLWTYHTGHALKPMAEWIIKGLSCDRTPPPVRLLLKHWARALIGRMALRYRRWEPYGEMPDLDCLLWVAYGEDGNPVEHLQVGRERFELAELQETDTSVPQITGWVMSMCRVQLWQIIQIAGAENIVYMDTDSLLVDRQGHHKLQRSDFMIDSLVRKAIWDYASVHGPRNIELDRDRRLSGVPRHAERKGPLEWEGMVMRGVKESIIRGELDHVAELNRTYHVGRDDPRRERCHDGTTQPYHHSVLDACRALGI